MNYQAAFELMSQCALGAMLVTPEQTILALNPAGDRLLHGHGQLIGQPLPQAAQPLRQPLHHRQYANIAFGEYLRRCPTPEISELPEQTELIVFREAADEACHDMLITALNGIDESVILFDAEERIYFLNDAAVNLDSIVTSDVLGQKVTDVYHVTDGSFLKVPQVIQNRRPAMNFRQRYTTRFGKNVDIIANVLPIVQNGQTLGAFNVMEDWSASDQLHKQIIDLQSKLLNKPKRSTKGQNALPAKYHFSDIIHISPCMNQMVDKCKRIARSSSSVMLYGETGTGKELLAQSIHNASDRSEHSFLAINCAAIPENLLEGLLFGTEGGAYTGAESRPGLFEQADGGTLLLDEINSMSLLLQAKLLRVLQDGMVRRVGGTKEIHVDVRVLSNTNTPPQQAIDEKKLRQDLFYRLGVINITIPPLRTHKEDIPLLTKSFILRFNKKLNRNVRNIDQNVLACFNAYNWPGNVRELEHAIESAMNILPTDQSFISADCIPENIAAAAEQSPIATETPIVSNSLNSTLQNVEFQMFRNALIENKGNISKTARALGISRQKLQYHIKRNQLDVKAILAKP
jgi:arginine utilization regulatory protein